MKATGIIRRIDDLGRIVIPKEIRKNLGIREGDPLEIFVNTKEKDIMFKKYDVSDEFDSETIQRLLNSIFGKTIKWGVFVRQDLLTTNDIRFPDDLDVISPEFKRTSFSIDGDEVVLVVSDDTVDLAIAKSVLKAFMDNND
jgi:AbrB family looped-hinge helix DNA binding protein